MANLTDPQRARLPAILKDPFQLGCTFKHCGINGTSSPVRPRGSWDAQAIWLGEAAGQEEEKQNCTFIGPAGKLAEEVLNNIGLPLDKNFLVPNVCLCRPHPPIGSNKQNRTPTIAEMKACRPHLEKIIRLHKPKLIVMVGGQAAKSAMEKAPAISKMVGKFFGSEEHDFSVDADLYAIWHPAYILRNMSEKPAWIKQLVRLRDYMIGRDMVIR